MTLTDTELEARLRRDLRGRRAAVEPAASDLVETVRSRHRAQRRRELRLGASALTLALLVIGLPVASSMLLGTDGQVATPAGGETPSALYELPTRGSLAGDAEWIAGVQSLSWAPSDAEEFPDLDWPDPPVEDRRVAWAGDVAEGRVALVLGRTEQHELLEAWFVGTGNATPAEMELVFAPREADPLHPLSLIVRPDPASGQETLVFVGLPGDQVDALTRRTVTASAEVVEHWESVPMDGGAGALVLDGPLPSFAREVELRVTRDGQPLRVQAGAYMTEEDEAELLAPIDVADPRNLRGLVDANELRYATLVLGLRYGHPAEELRPTLLAAGPVGGGSPSTAFLVGGTFPSGATAAMQYSYRDLDSASYTSSMRSTLAPAGRSVLEQVFAVATPESITVSGPSSGVVAQIYLANGDLHARVPLVDGAGVGPAVPSGAGRVRILDAEEAVVADAPLSEIDR